MSLLLVFSRGRLLGFVCLGPSKQSLMFWAYVLAKSGHLQREKKIIIKKNNKKKKKNLKA
jgi:hypothetical protein